MSNTSLALESLALIKDAMDRLDKTDLSGLSAMDVFYTAMTRYQLAGAHAQLEDLLHKFPGRET